ncbi:MAG: restriction endonuclease [Alphaproteobacteria bacterium]|nr:restriction endonuclease [Alphaproteobacteria bacterium]
MKISDAKGRQDENSGYVRVLGNFSLGQLISKIQATVISNGSELERIILSKTNNIDNLEKFINNVVEGQQPNGVYVCQKKILKKSRYSIEKIDPDLLIFIVQQKRICKIIELKDGDNFDTKKSMAEREHLEEFTLKFGSQIPFVAEYYICCFNQTDKGKIKEGFKNQFEMKNILTGKELCCILNLNYQQIVRQRNLDTQDNVNYFIDELLKISEIRNLIIKKIN